MAVVATGNPTSELAPPQAEGPGRAAELNSTECGQLSVVRRFGTTGSLLMAAPYLMVRLVDDFNRVAPWLLRLAQSGLAASVALLFLLPTPVVPPVG